MSTVDELRALAAAAAAAGYPAAIAPAPGAVRPCVTIGPPTIVPVAGVCDGHTVLTAGIQVTGAGATVEQLLDLVQAVDDVLVAIPTGWTITQAAPDPTESGDPAYTITVTKET